MNQTKEQAYFDLYHYANSYFQGYADESAVGRAYSSKLGEIKHAYSTIRRSRSRAQADCDVRRELMTLAVAAAGLIAWFVIFGVMEENFNFRMGYIIVLCIVMHLCTKNTYFSLVPLIVIFIGAFFGLTKPLVLLYLAAAAVYGAFQYFRKKKEDKEIKGVYRNALSTLLRLQKEMTSLLPQIRKELQEYEKRWFAENQRLLDETDHKDFLGDFFPAAFWWQVSPENMDRFREIVTCKRYGSWETKVVPREDGTEFDGLNEYTPLFHQGTKPEGKLSDYYPSSRGFMVCDLISRLTIVSAQAQTVQYQVPAHSELERFGAYMSVMSFAHDVDNAYQSGSISQADRDSLANDAFGLGILASEYADQTKTDSRTEYIPIHNHANFWTGQVALKPVESNGNTFYLIQYYTCQLPHLLENIQALHSLNIAGIDYNAWDCNPYFLAEFYTSFPDAM